MGGVFFSKLPDYNFVDYGSVIRIIIDFILSDWRGLDRAQSRPYMRWCGSTDAFVAPIQHLAADLRLVLPGCSLSDGRAVEMIIFHFTV